MKDRGGSFVMPGFGMGELNNLVGAEDRRLDLLKARLGNCPCSRLHELPGFIALRAALETPAHTAMCKD